MEKKNAVKSFPPSVWIRALKFTLVRASLVGSQVCARSCWSGLSIRWPAVTLLGGTVWMPSYLGK